jgi:probable addiction module antidote protein
MPKTNTNKYDAAEYLRTKKDAAAYLQAAFEDGDPAVIIQALGNIARARGMSEIAHGTNLRRESLYKALSPKGNPEFATVLKVINALGIKLKAYPKSPLSHRERASARS